MKNTMTDVRNHLVAMMERLGDQDASKEDIERAKALSELAQTFTNTVRVEIDARRMAGMENELPAALVHERPTFGSRS
jgi:hypothetical protein